MCGAAAQWRDVMRDRITDELEKELSSCAQLHAFLEKNQEQMKNDALHQRLMAILEEKGLSRIAVINESGLNEIYAYQIFAGKRLPSRDKLLCLCFAMELTAEEAQRLLRDCGYVPLYVKKRRDSIILFALLKGMPLHKLNELLYEEGEALLD